MKKRSMYVVFMAVVATMAICITGCSNTEVIEVESLISAIGSVSEESQDSIIEARNAYDALSDKDKESVSNHVELLGAELEYNSIYSDVVEKLISDIGSINIDSDEAINAARATYEELTKEQKAIVENYGDLVNSEKEYEALIQNAKVSNSTPPPLNQLSSPIDIAGSDLWGSITYGDKLYAHSRSTLYVYDDAGQYWETIYEAQSYGNVDILRIDEYDNSLYLLIAKDNSGVIYNVLEETETVIKAYIDSESSIIDFVIDGETIYVCIASKESMYDHRAYDEIERNTVICSYDSGTSWQVCDQGIDSNLVFTLEKTSDGILFAGSYNGIYQLEEGGWRKFGGITNNEMISELAYYEYENQRALVVSTYSEAYIIDLDTGREKKLDNRGFCRIRVYEEEGYILFPVWSEGLYVYDLNDAAYKLNAIESINYLYNVQYPFDASIWQGEIYSAGFSGYTGSVFVSPEIDEYRISVNGIKGASGARTSVVIDDEVHVLLNNGLLKFNLDGSLSEVDIKGWPMHEPWKISKYGDDYYFYDYSIGLWTTKDFDEVELIEIEGLDGKLLEHYGGSDYKFNKDRSILYIASNVRRNDDHMGIYAVDWNTKKVKYQFDIPDPQYGSQVLISVLENDESIILVEQNESITYDESKVYISRDYGKNFELLLTKERGYESSFLYNDVYYYLIGNQLHSYNPYTGLTELVIKDMPYYSRVCVDGDHILLFGSEENTLFIYDGKNMSLVDEVVLNVPMNFVWGIDSVNDFVVLTGDNVVVLEKNYK